MLFTLPEYHFGVVLGDYLFDLCSSSYGIEDIHRGVNIELYHPFYAVILISVVEREY